MMARCDEGYRCEVCGDDVTSIVDSDLYLRYVIGEIDPERLHVQPERHLRCNPVLSQFIEDERFPRVSVDDALDRRQLDPDFVSARCELVTRGYQRLLEIITWTDDRDITAYPLPEAIAKYTGAEARRTSRRR